MPKTAKEREDNLTSLLTQIRAKLEVDEGQTINIADITTLLNSIESESKDTIDDLTAVTAESIRRKKKIAEELYPAIESKDTELERLKKESNTEELESLRGFKQNYLKTQREQFSNNFGKISSHPNFEKAKNRFILPEKKGDEKEYDFSKLTNEELEKNLNTLSDLNNLDYFATSEKPVVDGNRFSRTTSEKNIEVKSKKDFEKKMRDKFKNFKQIEE